MLLFLLLLSTAAAMDATLEMFVCDAFNTIYLSIQLCIVFGGGFNSMACAYIYKKSP